MKNYPKSKVDLKQENPNLEAEALRFLRLKGRVENLRKEKELMQRDSSLDLHSPSSFDGESRSSARAENDNCITNSVDPKEHSDESEKDEEDFMLELDRGEKVEIHSFAFDRTYSGLLSGRINDEELNIETFDTATYPKNWGARKTLKIRPPTEEFRKGFKKYRFSAWLTSSVPIDPENDGSELVIIWFNDIAPGMSIKEIVQKGVSSIDWEGNAQDFIF
jgi:hypothetical protein